MRMVAAFRSALSDGAAPSASPTPAGASPLPDAHLSVTPSRPEAAARTAMPGVSGGRRRVSAAERCARASVSTSVVNRNQGRAETKWPLDAS